MVRRRRISKIRFGGKNISEKNIRERKIERIFRGPVFRDDSGAEIAEAAFVLPLVLVLIFGIMWFGRAFNIYSTLNRAAQEAAAAAAVSDCATCPSTGPANPTTVANSVLQAAHIATGPLTVTTVVTQLNPTNPNNPPISGIEVDLSYPYSLKLNGITCCPLTLTPITSGITLRAHAQALQEN